MRNVLWYKVMCIQDLHGFDANVYSGTIYDAEAINCGRGVRGYIIGECWYPSKYFMPLEEYREEQLSKILNLQL